MFAYGCEHSIVCEMAHDMYLMYYVCDWWCLGFHSFIHPNFGTHKHAIYKPLSFLAVLCGIVVFEWLSLLSLLMSYERKNTVLYSGELLSM